MNDLTRITNTNASKGADNMIEICRGYIEVKVEILFYLLKKIALLITQKATVVMCFV